MKQTKLLLGEATTAKKGQSVCSFRAGGKIFEKSLSELWPWRQVYNGDAELDPNPPPSFLAGIRAADIDSKR